MNLFLQVVEAGDAAVTSVSDASKASVKAMKKAMNESLGDDDIHVVLPGEDLDQLAEKYDVKKRDLIRVNSLNRRSLRAGQALIIPNCSEIIENHSHPNEVLVLKATNEHDQVKKCSLMNLNEIAFLLGESFIFPHCDINQEPET